MNDFLEIADNMAITNSVILTITERLDNIVEYLNKIGFCYGPLPITKENMYEILIALVKANVKIKEDAMFGATKCWDEPISMKFYREIYENNDEAFELVERYSTFKIADKNSFKLVCYCFLIAAGVIDFMPDDVVDWSPIKWLGYRAGDENLLKILKEN